jgi:hypothetical protein
VISQALDVLDLSMIVEAFIALFKPARELLRIANTLPPVIRELVNALLSFVIATFINILVMLIIGYVIELVGQIVGKTLYGGGLLLIRFLKLFNESAKLLRVCVEPGAGPCLSQLRAALA